MVPGEVDADLWNEHVARYIFAARFAAGKRVVDAGCGTGYGASRLAAVAAQVIALDVAPEAIAYARAHSNASNVLFLRASCAALPLAPASADVIVSFEVIEHISCWQEFLAETRRVLSPSGLLIISTPNRDYYAESRRTTGPNPFHVHEFDFAEFAAELRRLYPNVALFLQNHVAGICFQPCEGTPTVELAAAAARRGSPEDAHFFLAVCSAAPLPEVPAQVYLPATANVLGERERHIAILETEREKLRDEIAQLGMEKQNLVEMFRTQKAELEASNAWALRLQNELHAAQARVVHLQEVEHERTAWALRVQAELTECTRVLGGRIAELQADVDRLRHLLDMARESRWLKLGRKVNLGPDLSQY